MSASVQGVLERAISGNKTFSQRFKQDHAELLKNLSAGQAPEIMWIGCADSRVPETTICDSKPGDIFVHRNVANCIYENDLSASSAVEYSVAFLKVKEIILCGHTSCGGVSAGLGDDDLGETLNAWLAPLRELRREHQAEIDKIEKNHDKITRLAELNVQRGLALLLENPVVKTAIEERGLTVHGAIYDVAEAELRVLDAEA